MDSEPAREARQSPGWPRGFLLDDVQDSANPRASGSNGIDLDFQQIAVTPDVRGGRLVAHEANTVASNFKRFREECREGLDPHSAVEVEALSPGELRRRLDSAIEDLIQDVHQWNILARAEEHDRSMLLGVQEALEAHLQQREAGHTDT